MKEIEISLVIPAYNEAKSLDILYNKLKTVARGKKYETIFIDDGSTDGTFGILKSLHRKDKRVKLIHFKKNLGKAAALNEGFKIAQGSIVITLDADLQDDPGEIPKFIAALKKYDIVVGWKVNRKDSLARKLVSKFFNFLTRSLTNVALHDINCGFKAMKRKVAKDLYIYGELHRYIPVLAQWEGYKVGEVRVTHFPRRFGKSKYGASRLVKGFFDLITVKFLGDYGKRPMHLFGTIGILCTLLGAVAGLFLTVQWFQGVPIGNRPLLLLAVLLVVLGVQFISLGLLGEMIIRIKSR